MVSPQATRGSTSASEAWGMVDWQERSMLEALYSPDGRDPVIHRRLPPEILMKIFACVKVTSWHDVQVAHVCRLWRQLILSTPDFWVSFFSIEVVAQEYEASGEKDIAHACRQRRLETLLSRSQPRPFAFPGCLTIGPENGLDAYMLVELHFHRVTSLHVHISTPSMLSLFSARLKKGMPKLEDLVVTHSAFDVSDEADALQFLTSDTILPRLRNLEIPPGFMKTTLSSNVSSLVILSCHCSLCREARSLQRVLELLHRHPHLTSFQCRSFVRPDLSTQPPLLYPKLLQLRELDLRTIRASFISALVARLTVPSIVYVHAYVVVGNGPEDILPLGIRLLPVMATVDTVNMTLEHVVGVEVTCSRGGSTCLSLKTTSSGAYSFGALSETTLGMFPAPTSVTSLSVTYGGYTDDLDRHVQNVRRVFPALRHLKMSMWHLNEDSETTAWLPALRDGASAAGADLPLPALEHLDLDWVLYSHTATDWENFAAVCDDVVATLAHRARLGARLKALTFTCCCESHQTATNPLPDTSARVWDWLVERFVPFVDTLGGRVCLEWPYDEDESEEEESDEDESGAVKLDEQHSGRTSSPRVRTTDCRVSFMDHSKNSTL